MRFTEKVHALKNPSPCLACSKYLHVRAARHVHRSESGEHGSGIQRSTRARRSCALRIAAIALQFVEKQVEDVAVAPAL